MLRLKILASSVPIVLAAFFARAELLPANQPCIAIGAMTVQLATAPWQVQQHVAFTDDPARATVRVRIVDTPDSADFAIADDVDSVAEVNCGVTADTRLIGIAPEPVAAGPIIYLALDGDADYRIYVRSKSVTARDAAALIVGARGGHRGLAQAAL